MRMNRAGRVRDALCVAAFGAALGGAAPASADPPDPAAPTAERQRAEEQKAAQAKAEQQKADKAMELRGVEDTIRASESQRRDIQSEVE